VVEAHIGSVPSIFHIIFMRTEFEIRDEMEQLSSKLQFICTI